MDVSFGVVGSPLVALVECCIKVQEVGEETACCDLAGQLVEVVVAVVGQVAHTAFLLPYLYREYSCLAIAHTAVCAVEQFAYDASTLGRCVCTIVDGTEDNLVSAT